MLAPAWRAIFDARSDLGARIVAGADKHVPMRVAADGIERVSLIELMLNTE